MSTRVSTMKVATIRLRDMMNTKIATIEPNVAAHVAWDRMQHEGVRYFLVRAGGRTIGILSERHLGGRDGAETRKGRLVEQMMTRAVASAKPEATLKRALNSMQGHGAEYLWIDDGGEPAGVVTKSEVMEELGRDPRRAPLPGWLPRPEKMELGAEAQPAHIRMLGADLTKEQRERIRKDLGARLGKFADAIERVSVRVEDVNGPRGGTDQVCRIKVVLSDLPSVVFESQDASLRTAVGNATTGIAQAVQRRLQRKRMKPRKVEAQSQARSRIAAV